MMPVVGASARILLSALLVVVMAGTAVAFAVGVNFSPHAATCTTGYGSTCPAKKYNLEHIHVSGFGQLRSCQGHVRLTLTNNNQVPSDVKLVLLITTKSGKVHRITRTLTLGVGKEFTLNNALKDSNIKGAQLKLTVSDANGDLTTITKSSKRKLAACVSAASAHRSPSFTARAHAVSHHR
jgi:hypothetical protein